MAMLPDDTYRIQFHATIEKLRRIAAAVADVAKVEEETGFGFWRLSLEPQAAGACPFELVLRDDQHYGLRIGDEMHEDLPVQALEDFPLIADAVVAGRVTLREHRTQATGLLTGVETRILLGGDRVWSAMRELVPPGRAGHQTEALRRDRWFLAYRR